ncbi:hypothetical protein GCM10009665_63020 [Kitasatospora nipponensis]|uniref:4'-phosphopantetheinyl transferase domain-containing protein n=1 Tax=Kitasatospora nipponensis TaxID=258049 RepID=A0ABN1X0L6_9ACTN
MAESAAVESWGSAAGGGSPEVVEVEVWRVAVTPGNVVAAQEARSVLDEAEIQRADRFHRAEDRALYQVAHVALRRLLGQRLGLPADALPFRRAACPGCGQLHGRPEVASAHPLEFSLSHADGLAVIALARHPIGADVERRAAFEKQAGADVAGQFHPAERAELAEVARLAPERWTAAALRCWVRKEAYLKGTGMGLGAGLDLDYVGLGPGYPTPEAVDEASAAGAPGAAAGAVGPLGWALRAVAVPPEYDAAIALRLPPGATQEAVRVTVNDLDLARG